MSTIHQQQPRISSKWIWLDQLRALLPVMLTIYLPVFVLFGLIRLQTRIPVRHLTRDPMAIVDEPFYFGAISNIGILFWCSTVTMCWFCFLLLNKIDKKREIQRFLFVSGIVTFILMIDDFFLVHEIVFPKYFYIPEDLVIGIYGGMVLFYITRFAKIILNTEYLLIILAILFFGLSGGADKIPLLPGLLGKENELIFEDGFKMLGIISWLTYFSRVCMSQLKGTLLVR